MKRKTPYWWGVIERAKKRGSFLASEKAKAVGWTTCACGKQDARIPRHDIGDPKDIPLRALGLRFCTAVNGNLVDMAGMILLAIEKRASEVLRGIAKR